MPSWKLKQARIKGESTLRVHLYEVQVVKFIELERIPEGRRKGKKFLLNLTGGSLNWKDGRESNTKI